jgi:hypothetical protein
LTRRWFQAVGEVGKLVPGLKAIHFGAQERQRTEEHKQKQTTARELGFHDSETLERAKQFAALPEADQERILAEFRTKQNTELPEHEPRNPERRAERVAQQAGSAPNRDTEERFSHSEM